MNIRAVASVQAILLFILAAFLFLTILVSFLFFPQEKRELAFFLTFLIVLASAASLRLFGGQLQRQSFSFREAILVVSSSWFFYAGFGSLPYLFSGTIHTFTDAFFEAVSGFTTCGASILPDIESLGKALLFWRSLTHFIGGGGIVVLTVAILPALSVEGSELFSRESAAPLGQKSLPSIRVMAKGIWLIYLFFNISCTMLLWAGGMDFYNALTHAFAAISTGGFSPLNASVGTFSLQHHPHALYFEIVLSVFMFLSSVNFMLFYAFFFKFDFKIFYENAQFRFFLSVVVLFILLISLNLWAYRVYPDFFTCLRHSAFSLVSNISTTGFGTEDYGHWPTMSRLALIIAMFIGGSSGSTSGGLKIVRINIAVRQGINEVKRAIHPRRIFPIRLDQVNLDPDTVRNVNTMLILYLLLYLAGAAVLALWENDFEAVVSAVVACMNGVGPGTVSVIGPVGNYSTFSTPGKWILAYFMILGRLEILPLLALFLPSFWRR